MAEEDEDIDRLYQLPPDEFTAARNTLAKQAGARGPAIKQLAKPNIAAWAVNQLFWKERAIYDEVIKSAERMRAAHRQLLAGKSVDLRDVEATHRDAVRQATQRARQLLQDAGLKASDAVVLAVTETLDALPGGERPGRLTRPLKRMGFEALEGVTLSGKPQPPAKSKSEKTKTSSPPLSKAEQRAAQADAKELQRNKERLRFAEAAEREAETSFDRARRAADRAERTRKRLEDELQEAAADAARLEKEADRLQAAYEKAVAQRKDLEKKVI